MSGGELILSVDLNNSCERFLGRRGKVKCVGSGLGEGKGEEGFEGKLFKF